MDTVYLRIITNLPEFRVSYPKFSDHVSILQILLFHCSIYLMVIFVVQEILVRGISLKLHLQIIIFQIKIFIRMRPFCARTSEIFKINYDRTTEKRSRRQKFKRNTSSSMSSKPMSTKRQKN